VGQLGEWFAGGKGDTGSGFIARRKGSPGLLEEGKRGNYSSSVREKKKKGKVLKVLWEEKKEMCMMGLGRGEGPPVWVHAQG